MSEDQGLTVTTGVAGVDGNSHVGASQEGRAPVYQTESKATRQPLSEDKLKASMAATLEKIEARDAKAIKAQPPMPSAGHIVYTDDRGDRQTAEVGSTIEETMRAKLAWDDKPAGERRQIAQAQEELSGIDREAKELGISRAEALAIKQTAAATQQAAAPDQWKEIHDWATKASPDRSAPETINHLRQLGDWYERDSPAVVKMLAEHAGRPDLLAEPYQRIADQYQATFRGASPLEAFHKLAAANEFLERNPAEGLKWLADAYGFDVDLRPRAVQARGGWEDTMRAVGMRG